MIILPKISFSMLLNLLYIKALQGFLMAFKATYLGSNGWLIQFKNVKVIIDPWIIGDLVFPPGEWFFKGTLESEVPINLDVDLILLTQALPDHCHIPSLKKFKKDIDIICPKSAKGILEKLGFISINVLNPSEKITINNLTLEATAGAPVPQIENGYIVKDDYGSGFYIEPHGYFDHKIEKQELDAVITPTLNLELPIVGSFVKGAEVLPKLIKTFNPKYILSSTVGGKAKYSGILNRFISVQEYKEKLNCDLINLESMDSIKI